MAVGSFMGKTFTVSDNKVFTPQKLSGSIGANYASHDRATLKARSQYLSPKPRTYNVELLLRAQDLIKLNGPRGSVNKTNTPRGLRDYFAKKCEEGKADYFIVGNEPICPNRLIIESINEDWESVILNGALIECKLTLNLKEYL